MDTCLLYTSLQELEAGHFAACCLTEEEKAAKEQEIAGKEIKKAPKIEVGEELCLNVKNVRKYFPIYSGMMRKKVGEVKAIEDINFYARKGETLGIVGESGCGKTTLARCIMRVYRPEEGEIDVYKRQVLHAVIGIKSSFWKKSSMR